MGESSQLVVKAELPNKELECTPRWVIFPKSQYTETKRCDIQITNLEDNQLAWSIKQKDGLFRISKNRGVLGPKETKLLKIYLQPHTEWPQRRSKLIKQALKICFVTSMLTETVEIENEDELAASVFQETHKDFHYCTKIRAVLL